MCGLDKMQPHVRRRVLDQQCVVPFVWMGRIIAMSSRRLIPGDVVVLQRGKATCDMVLLRGAGLVEESMMSGEVRHRLVDDSCMHVEMLGLFHCLAADPTTSRGS